MLLKTKARSAIEAIIELEGMAREKAVSLVEVSSKINYSLSYLEAIFQKLLGAGIVKSVRGPGGGYLLARPLNKITVAEIIETVDMEDWPSARHHELDALLWDEINKVVLKGLRQITLADLMKQGN